MSRGLLLPTLVLCAALALAGCGGSSKSTTFAEDGFSIAFEHPSSLKEIEDIPFASAAGAADSDTRARGLDPQNVILVSRYDLDMEVTSTTLANVKTELDQVVSQAARQQLSGTRIEVGGLPGYEYRMELDTRPPVTSRLVVLFHDRTEYTLNCQATSSRRAQIDAACRQALDTLHIVRPT